MSAALRRLPLLVLLIVAALAASLPAATAARAGSSLVADGTVPVSPALSRDLATLPDVTPYGAFVHFRGGDVSDRAAVLADYGLVVAKDFTTVDVAFAVGTLGDIRALRREPAVSYLEADLKLSYLGDTGPWATNVRIAQQKVGQGPYRDTAGQVLDGRGVGVAVVDSGIDGNHPDLKNRTAKNFKIVCSTPGLGNTRTGFCYGPFNVVDVTTTPGSSDTTGGHGTHVAGIVAGDGTASRGTFTGVAPGATLYGFGVGEGISVFSNAEAYDYMIRNYDSFSPRIRVVNNSYGNAAGSAYDPESVFSKLTQQLLAKGVSILFAAGNGDAQNNGGTGADDRLSSTAKDPTPGVITVANYNDANTGTKDGVLSSSSSRGHKPFPANYPDISAPGSSITSTCTQTLPTCQTIPDTRWAPHYSVLGGTSMASPHVAGIAAMLYQARPDLTPAQVEDVLQDTARKFGDATSYVADPQNTGGTTAFDKGAGLADATAALDALGVAHEGGETTSGKPAVAVTSPVDGTVSDGTAPIAVGGSVDDGYVALAPFARQGVVAGDGGDIPAELPRAADIDSLSVTEESNGLRVQIGVRDARDVGPSGSVQHTLSQFINGVRYQSVANIRLTAGVPTAATTAFNATSNNAVPTDMTVVGNTLSYLLVFGKAQGNVPAPSPMSPAYNVRVYSFAPTITDVAPGGLGPDVDLRPSFGAPHTVRRPTTRPVPVATATVSVDGGPEQPAVLTGTSPTYDWSAIVDPTGLADGAHAITARLYLDGAVAATDSTGITVRRPVAPHHAIAITAPQDGETLPRSVVTVSGTAESNAPEDQARQVTVQLAGTDHDSGELVADGVGTWSLPIDVFPLPMGTYLLTTRLYVGDAVVASASRTVAVPVVPVGCAPQALTFWQSQYDGSRGAFTAEEAGTLADRAVAMSNGYFKDRQGLLNVLYVKGKVPAETTAARQYSVLLLNLAAGELSAGMSKQVGLSGRETLDARWYDTATLGGTSGTAAAWVARQLPGGDLAGANQVATALNKGVGITC